jgi:universal stress protein A
MNLPRSIVVATDFGPEAQKAIDYAIELARKLDARVHLVHGFVAPMIPAPEAGLPLPPNVVLEMERSAREALDQVMAKNANAGVPLQAHFKWEDPRHAVVDAATELGAELVVIGTHGRKGLKRALMGSVAESVVRFAPCPVLAVR